VTGPSGLSAARMVKAPHSLTATHPLRATAKTHGWTPVSQHGACRLSDNSANELEDPTHGALLVAIQAGALFVSQPPTPEG
jgi:hypothetical protein